MHKCFIYEKNGSSSRNKQQLIELKYITNADFDMKNCRFFSWKCCYFWKFLLIYYVFHIENRDDFKLQKKKLIKRILHVLMLLKSHLQSIKQYELFDISIQMRWEFAWMMKISWKYLLISKNINQFKWHISIFWILSIADRPFGINHVV